MDSAAYLAENVNSEESRLAAQSLLSAKLCLAGLLPAIETSNCSPDSEECRNALSFGSADKFSFVICRQTCFLFSIYFRYLLWEVIFSDWRNLAENPHEVTSCELLDCAASSAVAACTAGICREEKAYLF